MLAILFWVILILSIIGAFGPASWPGYFRFGPMLALFVIIGLKIFRVAL